MATTARPRVEWTAAELYRRFGPIPLDRIRQSPAPGTATVVDVEAIDVLEDRLCELIDGLLVQKASSFFESAMSASLCAYVGNFVAREKLGIVLGAGGKLEILPGRVRIPDVSFTSNERLAACRDLGRGTPIPYLVPDLAAELLGPGNTRKEMDEKLDDYFAAGVRLVWYVDPKKRTVRVFTGRHESRLRKGDQVLDGGDVVPGFALPLPELFDIPPDLLALTSAPKRR
jgi:Uma2 family endonuclease